VEGLPRFELRTISTRSVAMPDYELGCTVAGKSVFAEEAEMTIFI
jgi:hypothetical protein